MLTIAEELSLMDLGLLQLIRETFTCDFLDLLMPKITSLGNGGVLWIIIAGAMIITKKYRKDGIVMLFSLVVGVVVGNLFLKNVIARPRPCWPAGTVGLLITNPTDYSFPSGHTLSSFIAALTIMKTDKKMGIVAVTIASLIAFSRLYLYVHYPSDVLGGILLAFLIVTLIQKIKNHYMP